MDLIRLAIDGDEIVLHHVPESADAAAPIGWVLGRVLADVHAEALIRDAVEHGKRTAVEVDAGEADLDRVW